VNISAKRGKRCGLDNAQGRGRFALVVIGKGSDVLGRQAEC